MDGPLPSLGGSPANPGIITLQPKDGHPFWLCLAPIDTIWRRLSMFGPIWPRLVLFGPMSGDLFLGSVPASIHGFVCEVWVDQKV